MTNSRNMQNELAVANTRNDLIQEANLLLTLQKAAQDDDEHDDRVACDDVSLAENINASLVVQPRVKTATTEAGVCSNNSNNIIIENQ